MQVQNDAISILKPCCSYAACNRHARGDGRIGSGNIRRTVQIVGATDKVYSRRADRADADASNAYRVVPASEMQDAAAAAHPDYEASLDDLEAD